MDQNVFTWETQEYAYRRKTKDWYWALAIITISFATAAYILDNHLFAILIIVAGFTLALYGSKPPEELSCAITTVGVRMNTTLYSYSTLKYFWINELSIPPTLLLESKSTFAPLRTIRLPGDTDIEPLRSFLNTHIEEHQLEEPPFEKLFEKLGF